MWAGVGAGLAYCAVNIADSTLLLRALMLAVFIGGIARAVGLPSYDAYDKKIIVGIVIETVVPLLVVGLHYMATKAST